MELWHHWPWYFFLHVAAPARELVVPQPIQANLSAPDTQMAGWKTLDDLSLLPLIRDHSYVRPQVIFKHSTRCSVSSGALSRLNQHEFPPQSDFYFLDIIRYRPVSGEIAETFNVRHESPQIILLWQGNPVYHESHRGISFSSLEQVLGTLVIPEPGN